MIEREPSLPSTTTVTPAVSVIPAEAGIHALRERRGLTDTGAHPQRTEGPGFFGHHGPWPYRLRLP